MLRSFWRGAYRRRSSDRWSVAASGAAGRDRKLTAGLCSHRIQGGTVTELSESTLRLLDQTLDIDAHEMTPSHLWGDVFGDSAGRIAELAEPVLKKTGANDFYNPDVLSDHEDITDEN